MSHTRLHLRSLKVALIIFITSIASAAEPLSVGLQRLSLDTAANEKIEVAIWYPTTTPAREEMLGPYTMTVALNAAYAEAITRPLIVVSHGTGGNNMNHHELAAALARAGYIAVALTHPGDNYRDRSMVGSPKYFSERPRQVSRVLDALLSDAAWKSRIDAARVGYLGHSAGGFTGLALLGATPSIAATLRHCATDYDDDLWFCRVGGDKAKAIESAKQADYVPAVPNSRDPRIKAAVLVAPVGAFFTADELKKITIPVSVMVASRDDVLIPRFHAAFVGRSIPGAEVTTNEAGGHFMLVSKLSGLPTTATSVNGTDVNQDPPGFDRAVAISEASKTIPLWFDKTLMK